MTLQELYDKVMASEELKKSFAEAAQDKEKLKEWLKANGSSATVEQAVEFLKSKQDSSELSDDELESVAGGNMSGILTASICTAGALCAVAALKSEVDGPSASECFEEWK